MNGFDDFVNPKSMLTPGILGGVIMFITNSVCCQFTIPPRWVGLFLSFLFGLLVLKAETLSRWQRAVYYVLNSLVIFSMAFGTAKIGVELDRKPVSTQAENSIQEMYRPTLGSLPLDQPATKFIPAVLQMPTNYQGQIIRVQAPETRERELERQIQELQQQKQVDQQKIRELEGELDKLRKAKTSAGPGKNDPVQKSTFFKNW